ncbi:glutamate transport system substrate-binding protein [Streptosporangium becharense]|uniref:Glutamate transport system substrate-binding protein n=1 Tax=Streptosporangium becharense TaxID=1816182 RepID=A0A7W9IDN2_9ACTN|nr:glutamate ABC transporter substrate-binding protein [Streptosporangium becharense]MBB2912215.1 glutamate transport system substrate-binding protein [Streptosporangium becharense]MBB5818762.1 glutamate transport system substrate-binding protein [Streptosporangium becharense]
MRMRRIGAVVVAAAAVAGLSACGGGSGGGGDKFVVGIKFDQPGLGQKQPDGSFKGFDVDVAKYIAKELGYPDDKVEFKEAISANRESFIQQGQVNMVIATYSITDDRKKKVAFAGPYLVTGQDILTRADDTTINSVEDLKNKKVCGAQGSSSPQRLADKFGAAWKDQYLTEQQGYGACLPLLENKQVDAISTDATILAGFAAQSPGKFRLVGKTFSEEKYGVGVKLEDKDTREKINAAIEKMFQDGSWKKAVDANFGEFGKFFANPPAVERY